MLEAETLTLLSSSNIWEFRKREEGEDKTTKIYGNTPLKNILRSGGKKTIRGERKYRMVIAEKLEMY